MLRDDGETKPVWGVAGAGPRANLAQQSHFSSQGTSGGLAGLYHRLADSPSSLEKLSLFIGLVNPPRDSSLGASYGSGMLGPGFGRLLASATPMLWEH